jgi:hypothetical protein
VVIPTLDSLNSVLEQTLNDDPQAYIDILSQLSDKNPFSTTTDAYFTEPKKPPSSNSNSGSSKSSATSASGIIGAAVGLTLILAGFVVYRTRYGGGDAEVNGDNHKAGLGENTVAGETYTGETQHSNASMHSDERDKRSSNIFNKDDQPSNKETPQFDAVVTCQDSESVGSMTSAADITLATESNGDEGQPSVQPLDFILRKLEKDIDEMRMEVGDDTIATGKDTLGPRPKSVAEIENLLAKNMGGIR